MKRINASCLTGGFALAVLVACSATTDASGANDATTSTKKANDALLKVLPFDDRQSFADAHKGFIAPLPQNEIKGQAGNLIWNPKQYALVFFELVDLSRMSFVQTQPSDASRVEGG